MMANTRKTDGAAHINVIRAHDAATKSTGHTATNHGGQAATKETKMKTKKTKLDWQKIRQRTNDRAKQRGQRYNQMLMNHGRAVH